MLPFIGRRLLLAIPTLLGVATLTFFMLNVLPGDIVETMLRAEGGNPTVELVAAERSRLGLDRPLVVQYADFLKDLATFDLGHSHWTVKPVSEEIFSRLPVTLQVAALSMIVAILIAIPLGTIAGIYPGSIVDYAIRTFAIAGMALPSFWFGMVVALAMLWYFNWLPPLGTASVFKDPLTLLQQLILPAVAVGYRYSAILIRMMRSSVIETMHEDFVRTARAKGLAAAAIIRRHVIPNSLLPTITMIGLEFALLVGSLVVIEQVFSLNGIGRLFIESVSRSDFIVIQGIVLVLTVIFIVVNFLVDLAYAVIDPRIQLG
ncbi:ABC transporter permease [Sinorhizobium sp. RAC02]|uniref:ABC transporter permease n=1 Tax=Sinorhizobium sp. RAC02 TaxID=1842534 RepID=UPI00083CACF4|nr:ABC transporter permease [Sinorhizobium sp. RAC02]AOF92933.1 binding--dependent transport system inner membrane component family protein [Sinorhizobium sp. RAC02]